MPRCLLFRCARDRLKHLGTDQRGSVSAELALATPALLLLVLLVAQFAIWAHATHIAQAAASQALSAARVQGGDHLGCYVPPTVYRSTVDELEEWADYSDATGECANGHRWQTHDTVNLHAWDGSDLTTYRVPDLVRVPFGDRSRAYVACPACGKAVRFDNRF